ncbi:MAG TPA: hypothetical protein DCS93_10090 [Microscillaceae bacterium]|nr:hypothetical protein [Microscillaceae bacterium]
MSEYMNLTIAEKFLVLVLKTDKPTYKVSDMQRNAGIIAGVLLDLQAQEHIQLRDKKIRVLNPNTRLSPIHQQILERIASSSKERKLSTWFFKLHQPVKNYRFGLLERLESKGLVKIEHKKTWFVKYRQAYLTKENEQRQLLQGLKQAVNQRYPDDESMVSLLVLMVMGRMYKLVTEDKRQVKELRQTLKDRFVDHLFCIELEKSYRNLEAAASG